MKAALRTALVVLILGGGLPSLQFAQPATEEGMQPPLTTSYEALSDAQRRLVDNWVERFSRATNREISPTRLYESTPVSVRTTFYAVTHALQKTMLTDEGGASLGAAIDLIEQLDTVKGRVEGASGDLQFRIFADLYPGALAKLDQSQEFKRGADNTVYHKGYPKSYRTTQGVPSIQFSIADDGRKADVDIDYRSAKFPVALFNGHLSASNSDVRAGSNYDRHVNRWSGLTAWWKAWFGLPIIRSPESFQAGEGARSPEKDKGKIEDAVFDFLNSWLVEQNPRYSLGYVSDRSTACLEPLDVAEEEIPAVAISRVRMLADMIDANQLLGKPERLSDLIVGVRISAPYSKLVKHRRQDLFVLFDVPENRALGYECARRREVGEFRPVGSSEKFGRYYAAVLYLKTTEARGATLYTLWTKENKRWRMVSYLLNPSGEEETVPDFREPISEISIAEYQPSDTSVIDSAQDMLDSWLVRSDLSRVMSYVSDRVYGCMNLILEEGEAPIQGVADGRPRLEQAFKSVMDRLGGVKSLEEVLRAVPPVNPKASIVRHSQEGAFSLIAVPDSLGHLIDCDSLKLVRDDPGTWQQMLEMADTGELSYGNYYADSMSFKAKGGETLVLQFLWEREGGQWKVTAFRVVSH